MLPKISFILLLLSCLAFSSNAQVLSAGLLSKGNYARIRNIEDVRRVAFGAGGFLDIKVRDYWHIRPQILYNQVGGNVGERPDTLPLRLHYIENQYSLSYAFEGNYWHYQASAGVSVSYLWAAKYSRNPTYDLRWATHDFDYGWFLGFGFRYETGGWRWLSAELRHYWGRSSVFSDNFGFPVRNSVFSLRVAYSFALRMR